MITSFLIALNCLIFICVNYLNFSSLNFNVILGLNLFFFQEYLWQILTSIFMHGNWTHLILNMIVLYQFGLILEKFLGSLKFLFLYLVGGMICSLLSIFYIYLSFDGTFVNIVGASGAICVLMGYYAFINKHAAKGLLVAILLMSFAPIIMGIKIAWYAHIFGFVCGYMLAKFRVIK
ncbi:rhomboid family intramembrane serine protease [Campylobacter insulaenigrae]|uniref:Rhomboid family intramembrane serine protease n=2 Tax=Campylobacter insulaenigrae TaxID=260714 RepID=A0ABY3G2S0_9BACT|nr:rhomboid family intramembrane serine protease [Campylobacter insulaenigrae]AJC87679.1 putative membrane protein (rhomboid family) [Campylobacter insulaenigrae NCTC 12927]MCR6570124.1 rhomboid family intramembrane serine protease [Campylobacter insulaenigrae]MCR6571909.1 rhomboid family intramembrane serine protease [Campylobacter insulaenigrae]MCR6574954.1 rhomboid family intramembrane serine protease [Campylobacter insulaenigrae]MCR6576364.1 rhomboid family intramembrane serine protease [C